MKKNKPTREQHLAFARDRHISVTANAGSGKTSVLIDKFIDILLNDELVARDPTRILAITFTRVAAAEMFMRAAKAMDKLIQTESPDKLKILFEARNKLTYAKITTIHSFCSSLLRDYPIEAGIAPNFIELGEFDKSKLKDEALERVIEERLSEDEAYRELFDVYGLKTIREYLNTIISKPDILETIKAIYSLDDDQVLAEYKSQINLFLNNKIKEILIYETQVSEYPTSPKNLKQYHDIAERFFQLANDFVLSDDKTPEKLNEIILKLKEKVGRSGFIGYIKKQTGAAEQIDGIMKHLLEFASFEDFHDHKELISTARLILGLVDDFFAEFNSMKDDLGTIDFDDMIFKVRNMLKDEEVAQRVRNEFDYILLDEFQDTNNAQYEIVKALIPELSDPNKEMTLRCFIVGDGKQSIYAFRGADVRVFNEAIANIKTFNKLKMDKGLLQEDYLLPDGVGFGKEMIKVASQSDDEKLGALNLSCSFRLLPVPAAFVNTVFQKLEPEMPSEYDIAYEDLVCGRDVARLFPEAESNPRERIEMTEQFGTVSIMLNIVPRKETDDDDSEITEITDEISNDPSEENDYFSNGEADMLARHISQIVSTDSRFNLHQSGEYVKPKFGDIAILARNRKGFTPLITAFLNNKIPYQIQSGKGFFSAQEIIDLTEFLIFLSNDRDDLSIASILKSPYFGFTLEELFEISIYGQRNNSLFEKFMIYAKELDSESPNLEKVNRTIDIIARMKFYSTRVPLSSLISKIIETGGYWGIVAKSPAGSQIEANFEKIIQFARSFELKGFKTLNDFIEELVHLADYSGEGEAIHQTGENAVQIATIHGAKGAEFPIVYLYSTNFGGPKSYEPMLDDHTGLIFSLKERNGAESHKVTQPISIIANENLRRASGAEERRILYVALTRARDHLIITGELKENPKNGYRKPQMYLSQILKALEIEINDEIHLFEEFEREIKTKLQILSDGKFLSLPVSFKFNVSTIQLDRFELDDIKKVLPKKQLMLDAIDSSFSNSIYSASRLQEYESDPDKFMMKMLLGLVNDDEIDLKLNLNRESTAKNQLYGKTPGTLIHETMENVAKWLNPGRTIDQERLSNIVLEKLAQHNIGEQEELAERILGECIATAKTDFIQSRAKELIDSKAELELTMPLGEDYLTGAIDCMIENQDGEFEVWDWKSNHIHSADDLVRLKEYYRLQMETYSLMLMLLYPNQSSYTCRLLFTNMAERANSEADWIISFDFSLEDKERIESRLKNLIKGTRLL